MKVKEIKEALLRGENFGNEVANWYSYCNPSINLFWISIGDRNVFCKNIDSAAKRIFKLLNRGY